MSKKVEEFNAELPLWLVACLGKKVVTRIETFDGVRTYPVGSEGVLMAIRGADMPSVSVDVCLDPDDPTNWERLMHYDVQPATAEVTFSLELERGVIAFKVP